MNASRSEQLPVHRLGKRDFNADQRILVVRNATFPVPVIFRAGSVLIVIGCLRFIVGHVKLLLCVGRRRCRSEFYILGTTLMRIPLIVNTVSRPS